MRPPFTALADHHFHSYSCALAQTLIEPLSRSINKMPDISQLGVSPPSTELTRLRRLYAYAISFFQDSPLVEDKRKDGINFLFNLLTIPTLSSHPVLHAMVHATIGIDTPFDERNECENKIIHLNKAREIPLELVNQHGRMKEGGEYDPCQGCLYARLQIDVEKGSGEKDTSDCNTVARLSMVVEEETEWVTNFNWGCMDDAIAKGR